MFNKDRGRPAHQPGGETRGLRHMLAHTAAGTTHHSLRTNAWPEGTGKDSEGCLRAPGAAVWARQAAPFQPAGSSPEGCSGRCAGRPASVPFNSGTQCKSPGPATASSGHPTLSSARRLAQQQVGWAPALGLCRPALPWGCAQTAGSCVARRGAAARVPPRSLAPQRAPRRLPLAHCASARSLAVRKRCCCPDAPPPPLWAQAGEAAPPAALSGHQGLQAG